MCIFYLETLFHVYILFGNLISCVYFIWKPYFMCIYYLETLFHVYILFGNLISCVYLIWKPYFMCISYLETLFHVYIKTTLILHLDYSLIVFTVLKGV